MFPINFKRRAPPDANGDCSAIDRIGTTLQRRLSAIRKRALDVDDFDAAVKRRRPSAASCSDEGVESTRDVIDDFFEQKHRVANSDQDDNTSSEDDDDGSLSDDGITLLPLAAPPHLACSSDLFDSSTPRLNTYFYQLAPLS